MYSASVRFSAGLLLSAARCSSARENCVLADCRFAAFGSPVPSLDAEFVLEDLLEAKLPGDKTALDTLKSTTAKTGETRAKLLWKKREEKTRRNARENGATHKPPTHAKFVRLNFMHNPPPQDRYLFDASSTALRFVNV